MTKDLCIAAYCIITFIGFSYGIFEKGFSPFYFALMFFLDILFISYMKSIKN